MFGFGGGNNKSADMSSSGAGNGNGGAGRHGESSPLLAPPSNISGSGSSSNYYFLGKGGGSGTSDSVRDADGGEVVEGLPQGATTDEFAPKLLGIPATQTPNSKRNLLDKQQGSAQLTASGRGGGGGGGGIWSKLFGGSRNNPGGGGGGATYGEVGTLVRQRKAPIKIEPKVFFANERTFLAWMHLSVILAGASIAILAFSEQDENPLAQLYGVMILPVAIAFIVYSMYQYSRRTYMIRNRHPGPYEDTVGPTVLGVMLMISIIGQFLLKLYSMAGAY